MRKPPSPRSPGGLPPRRSIDELLGEGLRLHQSGRASDAAALYRQVLAREPGQPAANHLLGLVHLQHGDAAEAVRLISRAVRGRPNDAQYFANLGVALKMAERYEEAVDALDRSLALNPNGAAAWSNRGMALKALGRLDAAVDSYQRALAMAPTEPGINANLGNVLSEAGDLPAAEAAYREALRLAPFHITAVGGLCTVLEETARVEQERDLARAAIGAIPGEPLFHYRLGRAHSLLRQPAEAATAFREAVRLKPDYGVAWCLLSETVERSEADAEFRAIAALAANERIGTHERAFAGFALGRALADLGRHDESIDAFERANTLAKTRSRDSAESEIAAVRARQRQFEALPAEFVPDGYEDFEPIFVVGLPRSGKTTIESILSTHPDVTGIGEQRLIPRLVTQATAAHGDNLLSWPSGCFRELGRLYAEQVGPFLASGRHPVDTLPPNFMLTGIIRLVFPRARIIHARRNRFEHLVALYEKFFTSHGYLFTADLAALASYYDAYEQVMELWRRRFPEAVFDVDVADKAQRTRIFEASGLLSMSQVEWVDTEPRITSRSEAEASENRAEHLRTWEARHPELVALPAGHAR